MELQHEQKLNLMRSLNWGYSNTSFEDMLATIEGTKPDEDPVWGFNRKNLFIKSLERLPWHYVVALWGVETMKQMYTEEVAGRIWPHSRREYFDRAFKLLRGETLPATGWGAEYRSKMQHTILSHWRNGAGPRVLSS
ncbi:MAG: hypothetical protein LBM77_06380 [Spirochaetaceae bacterium]|jgi:hypothetical protein|nr:hypothetical protein [Spirochaetaceae bacterium]